MPSITYIITRDDQAITLDVEYTVDTYYPGNTWDPHDYCEPPSGGVIESLEVKHEGKPFALTGEEEHALCQHIYVTHDYSDDGYDPDMDRDERTWSSD